MSWEPHEDLLPCAHVQAPIGSKSLQIWEKSPYLLLDMGVLNYVFGWYALDWHLAYFSSVANLLSLMAIINEESCEHNLVSIFPIFPLFSLEFSRTLMITP
ncbi:hypothetical protein ACJX0J_040334 [Zea mays]